MKTREKTTKKLTAEESRALSKALEIVPKKFFSVRAGISKPTVYFALAGCYLHSTTREKIVSTAREVLIENKNGKKIFNKTLGK